MGFKHFSIQIVVRLVLLLLVMVLIAFLIGSFDFIKAAFCIPILTALIIELYRYINRINEDYINFLNALANKDYTLSFNKPEKGRSFKNIYQNFDKISHQFRTLNFERELQFQHLQRLISHIDIGIISFDETLNIHLVNNAFKNLFDLPFIDKNQSISKLKSDFASIIKKMDQGENQLYKLKSSNQLIELSLNASQYDFKGTSYKLISIKNIHSELDSKEQESFQKLISVLTHEIMNSVSPIVSLSSTLDQSLNKSENLENLNIKNLKEGINAIHNRSRNLLNFTHQYRKLTRLPKPVFENIKISNLIQKINKLYQEDLKLQNIKINMQFDSNAKDLYADEHLLEQAIINIYKNAVEALNNSEDAIINIKSFITLDKLFCLQFRDNGKGISADKLTKVFIPFYTDKEEGSGIGLSLCKQIMKLHGGRISIDSKENEFTIINLYFRQKSNK